DPADWTKYTWRSVSPPGLVRRTSARSNTGVSMAGKPKRRKPRRILSSMASWIACSAGSSSSVPAGVDGVMVMSGPSGWHRGWRRRKRSGPEMAERVAAPLLADRGLRPVARQHPDVVGERHDACPHRLGESAQVAPGKVGSAYRAGEQLVAGEQDPLLFHEEAAVPRGVAGGVEHLEGDSGEGVALSVGQVDAF